MASIPFQNGGSELLKHPWNAGGGGMNRVEGTWGMERVVKKRKGNLGIRILVMGIYGWSVLVMGRKWLGSRARHLSFTSSAAARGGGAASLPTFPPTSHSFKATANGSPHHFFSLTKFGLVFYFDLWKNAVLHKRVWTLRVKDSNFLFFFF